MSEPMKSGMFASSNLLVKFVAAAALVSGAVAFTAYVLIGDGNISSDDINTIFDQALQENPELVTTLCEENLNESAVVQAFLQDNSDSSITVDNDVLGTVEYRCTKILVSTTTTVIPSEAPEVAIEDDTTSTSTTVSSNETTSDEDIEDLEVEGENEEYFDPECDKTLSKEYSNDPSQVTVTVAEAIYQSWSGPKYQGILLCWEPMLVDGVEPQRYLILFGYTLDDGLNFGVDTASSYDDDPLLTQYFFDEEYWFDGFNEEAEKFVTNGKLTIYFNIEAYNEKTDSSYYSGSTKTVSITINDPRD